MKLLISGVLNSGKSLLLEELQSHLPSLPIKHSDDLLSYNESFQSVNHQVREWFYSPPPWCIVGVRVPYAVLSWNKRETAQPADLLVILKKPLKEHKNGAQKQFSKTLLSLCRKVEESGMRTWWREYDPRLAGEILEEFNVQTAGSY